MFKLITVRPSLVDLIANVGALAERFENYEPADGDLNAPLMAVKLAQFRRAEDAAQTSTNLPET